MTLNREQLKKAAAPAVHEVTVDGKAVKLRRMSVKGMGAVWAIREKEQDPGTLLPLMAALCLCDDAGALMYAATDEDLAELAEMDASFLSQLSTEINKLHGWENENPIEDAAKN